MKFFRRLAFSYQGIAPFGGQAFSVTPGNQQFTFNWSSPASAPAEWIIWFNVTNNYGTAAKLYAGGTITGAETSKTISTTNNSDITPLATGVLVTGTKYYFWLTQGDGSGNAVGSPTGVQTSRAFITLIKGAGTTTLRVPYDLTPATAAGGSEELGLLFFSDLANAPIGTEVVANATSYGTEGNGFWEDQTTGDPSSTVIISGSFQARLINIVPAPSSFTFWNREP